MVLGDPEALVAQGLRALGELDAVLDGLLCRGTALLY